MTTNSLESELKIITDSDRMRAFLCLSPDEEYSDVTEEDVIRALQAAQIQITQRVRERISELVASVRSGTIPMGQFVLAEGFEPTEPQDAQFVPADAPTGSERPEPSGESHELLGGNIERMDYFGLTHIHTTETGRILGQLRPPVPGSPGADVFGRPVQPPRVPVEIVLGENVELGPDGRTVRATSSGMIHWVKQRLSVLPVVEIAGNVDFESGSVDAPVNVLIRGNVEDGFHVRSTGDIAVNGYIGACEVKAGGNIQVRGGILGKDKARVETQGQVVAKFCNACDIRASGDLIIAAEAIHSRLYTLGRIQMPRGKLIGRYAYARCGGEVKTIGSNAGIKTAVAIGNDPEVRDRCAEIDETILERRKSAAKIRQAVGPLLDQGEGLPPAQRERVTKLLCHADKIDAGIEQLLKEKEDMLKRTTPDELPSLLASSLILPGVTIIIGDLMTTFDEEQKGPVRIMRRTIDGVEQIVSINELTGNVRVLPSRNSCQKAQG